MSLNTIFAAELRARRRVRPPFGSAHHATESDGRGDFLQKCGTNLRN
jgi:hypothetical protein